MPITPPSAFESNRAPCEMCGGYRDDPWETDATKTRCVAVRPKFGEPHLLWTVCDECHTGLISLAEDVRAANEGR
ncbi:MAG TPA: hypothetical protein VD994_00595 [Prosthecobacter sp.]|nr:hypothetical protein [Prosthecobacter sp.]